MLLGDLVWQYEGITLPAERPWPSRPLVDHDPEQVRAAISHVAPLPTLQLLPSHDARSIAKLPVFPGRLQ